MKKPIGKVNTILVVVPVAGKLRLAEGGVFSHYEFAQPLAQRLTDEQWRAKLNDGSAPAQPDWLQALTVSD